MVGRLQGTCGGIGGEATTVIIIRRIDFRAPLGPNRLTNYIDVSTGCRLIILCPCVITETQYNETITYWHVTIGMNHLDSLPNIFTPFLKLTEVKLR